MVYDHIGFSVSTPVSTIKITSAQVSNSKLFSIPPWILWKLVAPSPLLGGVALFD